MSKESTQVSGVIWKRNPGYSLSGNSPEYVIRTNSNQSWGLPVDKLTPDDLRRLADDLECERAKEAVAATAEMIPEVLLGVNPDAPILTCTEDHAYRPAAIRSAMVRFDGVNYHDDIGSDLGLGELIQAIVVD